MRRARHPRCASSRRGEVPRAGARRGPRAHRSYGSESESWRALARRAKGLFVAPAAIPVPHCLLKLLSIQPVHRFSGQPGQRCSQPEPLSTLQPPVSDPEHCQQVYCLHDEPNPQMLLATFSSIFDLGSSPIRRPSPSSPALNSSGHSGGSRRTRIGGRRPPPRLPFGPRRQGRECAGACHEASRGDEPTRARTTHASKVHCALSNEVQTSTWNATRAGARHERIRMSVPPCVAHRLMMVTPIDSLPALAAVLVRNSGSCGPDTHSSVRRRLMQVRVDCDRASSPSDVGP